MVELSSVAFSSAPDGMKAWWGCGVPVGYQPSVKYWRIRAAARGGVRRRVAGGAGRARSGAARRAHRRRLDAAARRHQVRLAPAVGGRAGVAVAEVHLVRVGLGGADADGVLGRAGRALLLAVVARRAQDQVILVVPGERVDVGRGLVVGGWVACPGVLSCQLLVWITAPIPAAAFSSTSIELVPGMSLLFPETNRAAQAPPRRPAAPGLLTSSPAALPGGKGGMAARRRCRGIPDLQHLAVGKARRVVHRILRRSSG